MLYEFGLFQVKERPAFAVQRVINDQESQALWQEIGETGTVQIERLNPWLYLKTPNSAGNRAIWTVERDYRNESKKHITTLSQIALFIWLTRNWSTQDIMAKVKEIKQNDVSKTPCARLIPSRENRKLCRLSHHSLLPSQFLEKNRKSIHE
jgi:hypothetical protein